MQHVEGLNDIRLLADLFKTCDRAAGVASDSEDDDDVTVKSSATPGSIGGGKKKHGSKSVYDKSAEPARLTEEEFYKNEEQLADTRDKPEYDIAYRQAIGAEDVFLQMGGRTPATMSCEDMVVTIKLPGEDRHAVELNVTHTQLELTSLKYRLDMPLPHAIDPQRSNAKWDPDLQQLTLTLRLDREFDFVNF